MPEHRLGRLGALAALGDLDLRQLQVPVAELVPGEVVERFGQLGELERLELAVHIGHQLVEQVQDPAVGVGQRVAGGQRPVDRGAVGEREPGGVPQLRGEVAGARRPLLGDSQVRAGVRAAQQREPGGVGAVAVDPGERVDAVAARLRHLLAVGVADEAVQVDVLEGHSLNGLTVLHGVQAEHHHPGDPEEEDVVARRQHGGRVELGQVGRLLRPAQRGERPQARREPRVEHVLVLAPALAGRRLLIRSDADDLALRAVPDRDAVAPPQLARDAPVVQVVDPVEVALGQVGRVHGRAAVADGVTGGLGDALDLHPPLQRQARLDDRAAALAVADGVHVRALLGHDPTLVAQRGDHGGPRLEAVQALERAAHRDDAPAVHDGQVRQAVALADLEVVRVVRGRHLDGAGAELRVDVLVGDDRHAATGQRHLDLGADQVRVPLVLGVHRDGRVTEHRLGARGRDDDRVRAVAVADRHQLAVVVGVLDLDVRQGRLAARAPVDDALGAVDQTVVEHLLEDRLHGAGQALVHGEPLAAPVDAVAEAAHLVEDLAAVLLLPLPHARDELLAAEVAAGEPVVRQVALHRVLGRDARVVHAGQPQDLVALHPAPAGEGVHDAVVEGVAHVQAARHVRRRQHDRERRLVAARVGGEVPAVDPALVQLRLYLGRLPRRREIRTLWSGAGFGHD